MSAKLRDKAMRDLVERGSGPMERKRAVCEKLIAQMGCPGPAGGQGPPPDPPVLLRQERLQGARRLHHANHRAHPRGRDEASLRVGC